jgi:hypothetical protein
LLQQQECNDEGDDDENEVLDVPLAIRFQTKRMRRGRD